MREEDVRDGNDQVVDISEGELYQNLQNVGDLPATVPLLNVVPSLQVAWADGNISLRERAILLRLAKRESVFESRRAHSQLNAWLDERPPDAFFRVSLHALATRLRRLPAGARTAERHRLLDHCTTLAAMSGTSLGLGHLSREERQVMEAIVSALTADNHGRRAGPQSTRS